MWIARFTAVDETGGRPAAGGGPVAEPDLRPLLGCRLGERGPVLEPPVRGGRATNENRIAQDVAERVEGLADQVWRTAFPAPEGFDSPIEFHALGLTRGRRTWSPPSSGHTTLAVAPFVNRTGLDAVGRLGRDNRILVSRQEELDKLSEDALATWERILVLSDTAQGEAEDGPADADKSTRLARRRATLEQA